MKNDVKIVNRTVLVNTGRVVDDETGEILELNSKDYRIIIEDIQEQEDSTRIRFQETATFIKSFRGNGVMLKKYLTPIEIATVVFLTDFICYDDCVLRKNGDKRGKALSIQDLADLCETKYNTFRKTIYSLKDKEVIGFHETGEAENGTRWITVNPFIFCRGIEISIWVVDFYSNTMWAKIVREQQKTKKNKEEPN